MEDANKKSRIAYCFRDLDVYQMAFELALNIFEVTKGFPEEERYSLTDQIRRSSRSVGGQIAEAWGKRRYVKHFISKLTDADAEQMETQHWIDIAVSIEYIQKEDGDCLIQKCNQIGKMIGTMINKADQFCKTR